MRQVHILFEVYIDAHVRKSICHFEAFVSQRVIRCHHYSCLREFGEQGIWGNARREIALVAWVTIWVIPKISNVGVDAHFQKGVGQNRVIYC